jgi:hypothetical protein
MKLKIPKLTKKERRMWIEALQELLNYYKGETKRKECCLLCKISATISNNSCIKSKHCPWYWFTGGSCSEFANAKRYKQPIYYLRIHRNSYWVKLRVRQIPQWISTLQVG